MRGRGMAFLIGRAAGQQRAQDMQNMQSSQNASSEPTKAEKLEELGSLHDKGVLTDDEFKEEKKKILSGK